MNEEALKDAYNLFSNTGYNGDQNEFYTLLSENSEAFADSYGLFKGSGYDGSEDDYKELLGLKKKDVSVSPSTLPQKDSEDTALQSEASQPSLEQDVQSSLEERFSGLKDLPKDEQTNLRKQEELRPFFEANGLDLDEKLDFDNKRKALEESDRKKEEADKELGFLERIYKNMTSPEEIEDMLVTEEDSVNNYFSQNSDKIFEAEKHYNRFKVDEINSTYPPEERLAQFQAEGIDLGHIPIKNLRINGEEVSVKDFEAKAYDQEFIDQLQAGEVSMEVLDTQGNEVLENLNRLLNRQMESGGQWGDIAQSFYAGGLDMLVAGPLELLEGVGAQASPYQQTMFKLQGGFLANKVHKYANSQRDKTRLYEQSSMSESLLEGNYGNAMFQAGNAIAESAPLILGMYASAPLGFAEGATLGFAGVSAGSLKDLELREQRLKGEIDISEGMLLANVALTGGAEMFFEKFTLDIINSGRKIAGFGKMKPVEIADGFVRGLFKAQLTEGLSEGATELSNAFADLMTRDIDWEKGKLKGSAVSPYEVIVRSADATIVGTLLGTGMHTTPYLLQSLKKFEILDKNISTVFTMEDGSVKEMSRAEALKFAKDPEVADQVRRSVITMETSMNDVAKQELEEIIYGYYAPDAVESRARMFDKEKAVQEVLNKVEASEEVSTEDLNALSEAMAEMETEGKESKYNISSSTNSTRARAASILKDKGVEIVNATQTQDLSKSNVTETVNVSKIETQEQYDSIKEQVKNKNKKPKVVVSESQQSITINGESVQSSEVVQGSFKNLNEAKNAMKDFEAADKAAKAGEMLESDLFPANNKLFLQTKKEGLDDIPKEVIDGNDYHVLTSEKEGLNQEERNSRMEKLKSMLDAADATYYTVQGVYNGVAEESLVVTGIDNAKALDLGRQFDQESIFSAKDGLMFSNGSVVPLKSGKPLKGTDARKMDALTIMSVGGRKMSLHTGLDWSNTSHGKNFNSNNLHKLDEKNADYDSELFEGVTEDRKRALGFALKFLNSIGGLNVTVIRNSEAMKGQMESLGIDEKIVESGKRSSFFRGADKTIYVNLETVQGNTLFHEIIHPMVDFIKKADPTLYKRIEAEVAEGKVKRRTTKGGRKIKGSYLEWAQTNYASLSREGQIEEAFAEMMGDAAYGHFKNKGSRLNRLREVIKAILTKLGVTSFPENVEAIDLNTMSLSDIRTNLAEALVDGRKVTVGGVEFEVGETDAESRFQLDAIDRRTQIQYSYGVNSKEFAAMEADGLITSGMTMQDFAGKNMMIHAPDAMFSGSIIDADGTILIEGKGGVMYPFVFNEEGYFWASTENAAEKMVEQLNAMMEDNDGKIYMALTTATQNKLLSSTATSRGILNLFSSENFINKIGMNKSQLYKAIIEAANNVSTVTKVKVDKKTGEEVKTTKKVGLDLKLKPYRASSDFTSDIVEKIWSKLDNSTSTFDDRKNFSDRLLTNIKKFKVLESGSSKVNFVNFINTTDPSLDYVKFNKGGSGNINSLKRAIINILTEPELREKDGDTNRIYAVLEIDGPVKAEKSDKYESYGTAIVSDAGNRTKIHRLDNRDFWYDVTEEPGTNVIIGDRKRLSSANKMSSIASQVMPSTAGISTTPLKISEKIRMQVPQVEEVQWQESKIGRGDLAITKRSEKVREAAQDYFDRKITQQEHLDIVQDNSPIKPITQFMNPASLEDIETAVGSKVEGKLDVSIPEGTKVGVRLDISAYTNKNIWAITVHEDGRGKAMSYTNVARIDNVEFISSPKVALGIARGKLNKSTIARMLGEWSPIEGADAKARGENAKQIIAEVMNDPSWSQVGMNPFRHSYFYDRLDGMPVVSAEQVVQIGGLVYAKNAEKTTPFDERFEDKRTGLRFQVPTYEMEYTPNALVSLNMIDIDKANPTEWISRLSKGVKGTSKDIATMGLEDILKAYQKESKVKSIPKEVVAQLIATNMADIETKILRSDIIIDPYDYDIGYDGDKYIVEDSEGRYVDSGVETSLYDNVDAEELTESQRREIIEAAFDAEGITPGEVKYPEITLPGGENYREFLIKDKSSEDIFTAPHYDELGENLIASARVDDRVGPNGEKILLVQEIQSDWVQGTNKDNFRTKSEIEKLKSRLNDIDALQVKENDIKDDLFSIDDRIGEIEEEINDLDDIFKIEELKNELSELNKSRKKIIIENEKNRIPQELRDERTKIEKELIKLKPYLPWNQTDLWVGLTIRKLINQASKEGYDQIAFVNGEQSDIVQSHTGENKGITHEFYNKIVPKNINNELKRLVKGTKADVKDIQRSPYIDKYGWTTTPTENITGLKTGKQYNTVINLTPELKAATDKVGPLRFQAPQEEGESNVYTDGLVSIGWDISKAMQDLNYMSGTYLTGFIDQDSFRPKKRKRYDIKLTTLLAKPFGTHSDKEVKEIIVRSRGALNAAIIEANEVGKRLKELNEKYNYTEQELNDLLHDHNKIKALEDSEIKNVLIEMRMGIDALSKTLIAEDLIAGQTMFTVDSNLGLYVTQAYKNFEVKGWEQTDNLIIQKLKDFLYREAKKDNPEATEKRLSEIADVSYEELNSDKEFVYNVKNGGSLDGLSRLTSIFKQRKEIPQEIKDFWGEIDDPIFNYNNTVKKVAQTITAERMYKELYEIGNGKFISDTKTLDTFNELVGSKWGSIEGKFVDNEMFAVMNQIAPEKGTGTFNLIFDKYMELVLLNKKTKTVWNPGTHVKNIIGNTAFATMNGHINMDVGTMYQDAKASMKATMGSSNAELDVIRKNLIEKGVLSSSASLEEIRNISKDLGDTDYDLSKYLDEGNGKIQKLMSKSVRYAGMPFKYFDDKATRAYQAEDDVWKFYGFLSEKARYIKAGISEKEADDMAARNIINLYPNYNEIPRIIRYIGRSPLVGSFVAFQAESFRNTKNAVKLGFEEIGSSNPEIRKIGSKRIAGTIATMTLLEGLQLYTMQFISQSLGLAGGDEEESEERRIRTMVAEWDRDGSLAYVDSGVLESKTNENQMENDKYFDYINFSSISGVGHIRDILRLTFTDIDTEVGEESAYSIIKKMYEPFLGEEMTLAVFLEAYENKGNKIYERTDDGATATLKMIEYVGQKVAMPGFGRNIQRIMESFNQDSERVPTYEALALFGLRISRSNVNKTMSINARNTYNDMRSRSSDKIIRDKNLLINEMKNNPDLDNDLNIIADLMAGARLNKVAGSDTKAILKGMGVSDVVIDLAYNRMLKNYKQDVLSVDAK